MLLYVFFCKVGNTSCIAFIYIFKIRHAYVIKFLAAWSVPAPEVCGQIKIVFYICFIPLTAIIITL